MAKIKNWIIDPAQRAVLPGIFDLENRRSDPNPNRPTLNAFTLPDGKNVMLRVYSKTALRSGFRMQGHYGVLCDTHMVVGYDPKRDRFHDVGLDAEELAGMIEWAPKFAGLMASSVWKRLDTHRPLVRSGNANVTVRDSAALGALLAAVHNLLDLPVREVA